MKPNVLCKKLDPMIHKEEWKKLRQGGLGGSDAGAICGVNPYKSGLEVFYEKIGELPAKEDNEAMEWGRTLEPIIAEKFAKQSALEIIPEVYLNCPVISDNALPFTVIDPEDIYCSPIHPFMFANPDRIIFHPAIGTGILEIKTSNEYNYSDWMEGNLPKSYVLQIHHYMYVMDCSYAIIAALIGGNKFRTFFIKRDEDLINTMLSEEEDFWSRVEEWKRLEGISSVIPSDDPNCVELNSKMDSLLPSLRYGENAERLIKSLYPTAQADTITDLSHMLTDAEHYLNYHKAEAEAKKLKDFYKQKLQLAMGENESASIGEFTAKFSTVNKGEYTVKATTYRTFALKEPKTKNLREVK